MAGLTQTIDNYYAGISEQPDLKKFPGQVKDIVNGIPDITEGLYKRPGGKRIGTSKLTNIQPNGSWFHYYRDDTEGSYIGQIDSDGRVRVWSCADGTQQNVYYHEETGTISNYDNYNHSGTITEHVAITTYLKPSSATATEDIQALNINDTTFLSNRSIAVETTGTTPTKPHAHSAYVELLRTENGRQYGLNVSNKTTPLSTLKRATRIKIDSDSLLEGDGTGACPGIGTQVFSVSGSDYIITTAVNATFTTSDINGGTNNKVTITYTNGHGFNTGDQLEITSDHLNNQLKATITKVSDTEFFYISAVNEGATPSSPNNTCTFAGAHRNKSNLIFRITTLGQQAISPDFNSSTSNPGGSNYRCTYNREIVLLHGGEGWEKDDTVSVLLDTAQGGSYPIVRQYNDTITYNDTHYVVTGGNTYKATATINPSGGAPDHTSGTEGNWQWIQAGELKVPARYTVKVVETEQVNVSGRIDNTDNGVIRPSPTPFDADTAVTVDTILGGIEEALPDTVDGAALDKTIIGNGIYLSCAKSFDVEVVEPDLMRVMQNSINDVTNLPNQCKDGYIIKISNARMSDEDDYYLKFEGDNGDGTGSWIECAKPGIVLGFNNITMPHVLQRQASGNFLVKAFTYATRTVGDDLTNPLPSFCGEKNSANPPAYSQDKKINKVLFFRNRLAFLSGENVILCKPGTLGEPDFFTETALTVSAVDSIDIACSSNFSSELFDGIEINTGLVLFSSNQQFLLSSDDTVLNPDTAKLKTISTYNYNTLVPPISLGTTVGYIDNSSKYSRFNEMANTAREGEPIVSEVTKLVPTLLPKTLDLLTNSRENQLVLIGKTNTDTVYGYKYLKIGEEQAQTAWFKWKLNQKLRYHFIINENYYVLDTDGFLQKINIVQEESDPSVNETVEFDTSNYLVHLDNYISTPGGTFADDVSTFSNNTWLSDVNTPNGKLVIIDIDANSIRVGRYAECTVNGTTITAPGNWEYSDEFSIPHTSIDTGANTITLTTGSTDHNLQTGDTIRWKQGSTQAAPIISETIYHVIRVDANKIQLANSLINANYGSENVINTQGTGTHRIQKQIKDNLYLGYLYEYSVHFPTIYYTQLSGERAKSSVNSYLTLHRVKLNLGKSGLYETTLMRKGKTDFSDTYESTDLNEYLIDDAPYLPENIQTVPVYERTDNVEIVLKSSHPAPATLHALSWEGDYSQRNYKIV